MASSSSEKSISPFLLQQAYAELRPGFDGETSQDAHQFLTEYLTILEQNEMKEDQVASEETVVRRTFGGETTTQVRDLLVSLDEHCS